MNSKLLRSLLFVPAYSDKYIDKALGTDADALILDLEDSVPLSDKQVARDVIKKRIDQGDFKDLQVYIRLNSFETGLLLDDLENVCAQDITGFMISKPNNAQDLFFYDMLVTQFEKKKNIPEGHFEFIPLIETTEAIINLSEMAKATPRNVALSFGGEDFLTDLSGIHGEPPRTFEYPRAAIAIAARAAGILPLDTPYLDVKDVDGFMKEEKLSFELGFHGCLLLHPLQIEPTHQCFTPSEAEIKKAQEIVEAIEVAKKEGRGVAMLGKKMIGPPMEKRARKVLQMVELINQKAKLGFVEV